MKGKEGHFLQTLYLTSCSASTPEHRCRFTLREKTRVSLLCWPVAPGPQITARRGGREKSSNSNSSELCLSRFPWGPLSHELWDLTLSKNMQRKALIFLLLEVLFLKTRFLSHERMSRTQSSENISDTPNTERSSKDEPPLLLASQKSPPSRSLTCTPAPLFLTLSRLSPSASSLPLHSPCLHTPLQERNRAREGVPNTDTFLLLLLLTRPSRSKQQQ